MHHKQSGELSLVLPEDNCEVVYKVNSATTASGNLDYARADMPYATDCNSSRFSLSSEAWFTSSTRTLDYSLADERTENGTRHSDLESAQWLMSMSLKAFPPNISYGGTSTSRGEWDDRYYGVWCLELSVSWLSTALHEYVQMLNTQLTCAGSIDSWHVDIKGAIRLLLGGKVYTKRGALPGIEPGPHTLWEGCPATTL